MRVEIVRRVSPTEPVAVVVGALVEQVAVEPEYLSGSGVGWDFVVAFSVTDKRELPLLRHF